MTFLREATAVVQALVLCAAIAACVGVFWAIAAASAAVVPVLLIFIAAWLIARDHQKSITRD